ncbi:MAG: nitrite reductase (NADH) small subunit [Oceanicoccus sp.]|jgi:nitrite reductase (NADH) small subunit
MNNSKPQWIDICPLATIIPNAGRCALIGEKQVAIFRIEKDGADELYAIDNHDPFSKANVLSRGIVGSMSDHIVVASPIYKQHFCLKTGRCLEEEETQLKTWPVRVANETVQIAL